MLTAGLSSQHIIETSRNTQYVKYVNDQLNNLLLVEKIYECMNIKKSSNIYAISYHSVIEIIYPNNRIVFIYTMI